MDLNRKDTPAPYVRRPQSPPHTPRPGSKRSSRMHKTPRDIYFEGRNGDNNNARGAGGDDALRDNRISHDLSLSAHTGRNSVVDSMLLSLNPDQLKLESPPYPSTSRFASPESPRARGHQPSPSLNSDYSFPLPSSGPRPDTHRSPHLPRGRRSNSSNFQSLSRIDSLTTDEEKSDTRRTRTYQSQRAGLASRISLPASRSGRISSKSSGSSSVDFGQMMRQSALPRRSASFEENRRKAPSPIDTSKSQAIIYNNIEAAPTPTVPSGPRSPAVIAPAPSQTVAFPIKKTFRNNGAKRNKMDVSKAAESSKTGFPIDPQSMPISSLRAFRPVSPTKDRKGSINTQERPPSQSRDHARERPGFFRRVFGSSRNTSITAQELPPSQMQSSRNSLRIDGQVTAIRPSDALASGPNGGIPNPPKESVPPLLTKKPSSFFRRRKKSISDNVLTSTPIPAIQADLRPPDVAMKHNPSVSSLRELMNPYLSGSPEARKTSIAGSSASAPKAVKIPLERSTVKPIFPPFPNRTPRSRPTDHGSQVEDSIPESTLSAKAPAHPDEKLLHPVEQSFLHDNSSNETHSNKPDHSTTKPENSSLPEKPMSSHTTSDDHTSIKEQHPPPFNDGFISSAQPIVDYVQKPGKRKTRPSKPPRSWTVPSDGPSTTAMAVPSAPAISISAKETVVAAVTSDDTTPRLWLRPEKATEDLRKLAETPPPVQSSQIPQASNHRPTSSKRSDHVGSIKVSEPPNTAVRDPTSPDFDVTLPFREDRVLAKRIFEEDENLVSKAKAAAWLGEAGPDRSRVRRAYMELFDWNNLNILAALMDFCGKLLLKGETQQVDRILDAFSSRWCACNPNHGFKAADVVHTICYSILLLNTDLHMAEIEQKMTRNQFIKNTLPTIRRVAADAAPDAFESKRASTLPARNWAESPSGRSQSPTFRRDSLERKRSFEGRRPSYRLSSRPSEQAAQIVRLSQSPTPADHEPLADECGPLVKAPFQGKLSAWEAQIEIVLRDIFNSIRQQRLPVHNFDSKEAAEPPPPVNHSLSAITSNMLRRTPSMLSKAGSEHTSYRGRSTESRFGTGRWTSKTRSRPRLYPSSTVGSSRTSLEDQSSAWTPSASSSWSRYSFGKTQTSMSIDSYSSTLPCNDYQQSIGFANALSQAIIREEGATDPSEDTLKAAPLLEDESLELAGAPWAKEGILKHKHHLEAMDKKAKDRNWVETFAVIEKGWMRLFSFNMNAKSMRLKAKNQKAYGGVVGGGNWMDSAEDLGKFLLRQTIASALPPPGYSKTRPHVWALSLPNGAVHLFQVGTPEIVKEFVTTANYWSARLSKEPLMGGISNIEYGWSDSVINTALLQPENRPPSNPGNPRPSLQSSIRSSIDQASSGGSVRPKLPGDRITISDWQPPQQSMLASVLLEVDQLRALQTYVKNIEEELQKNNELRGPMLLAFSSRHPNSSKAMANWERKSSYLLREIVKFRTYIDCLVAAQAQKKSIYASKEKPAGREVEQAAAEGLQDAESKDATGTLAASVATT
ncbi:MAG: hypothetical protein Q9220_006375 [cf. Caloplaca sp. 1 TL-2023]